MPGYFRIGTIQFTLCDSSERMIRAEGINYNATFNDEGQVVPNEMSSYKTEWSGEYSYDGGKKLSGIYNARQYFTEMFNETSIPAGYQQGIHEFRVSDSGRFILDDLFADAVDLEKSNQVCKSETIVVFETIEVLNKYLKNQKCANNNVKQILESLAPQAH